MMRVPEKVVKRRLHFVQAGHQVMILLLLLALFAPAQAWAAQNQSHGPKPPGAGGPPRIGAAKTPGQPAAPRPAGGIDPAAQPLGQAADHPLVAPTPRLAPAIPRAPQEAPRTPQTVAESLARFSPPSEESRRLTPPESLKKASLDFFAAGLPAAPPQTADATSSLLDHLVLVRDGRAGPLPKEARRHHFRFVPGFCWDALPRYFGPNLRRLRELGLKASMLETDPLGASKPNVEKLRKALAGSPDPEVIIGHSNGGNIALSALSLFPELQRKVTRVVALQSPYAGTAVADLFLSHPWIYTTAMAYARLLNPLRLLSVNPFFRGETLREMTRQARQELIARRPELRSGVKLFSVVSRVSPETPVKLLLWVTAGGVKALAGRDNDGVVVPEEGVVPGSRYALLEDVGHIDTVAEPSDWKHKILGVRGQDPNFAADLTEAIIRWIFER